MSSEPDSAPVVAVFTTGGTIASEHQPDRGGIAPSQGGPAVTAGLRLEHGAIEVVELACISSMAITPTMVLHWARHIDLTLDRPEVSGAILTTGTNGMEEVAFLLDILITNEKALVVTGAMRAASDPAPDGPGNLRDALLVASDPNCRGLGTLVTMNGEIHAARHVRKASGQKLDAFISPTLGPIGRIDRPADGDRVRVLAQPKRPAPLHCEMLEERVALLTAAIGVDSRPMHDALDAGAQGLVIEAFSGGDLTPQMVEGVQRARRTGIPVIVASRGWVGDPTDTYAGPGEGAWLREQGVIFARGLSSHKARLLLMAVLGANRQDHLDELLG